MGIFWKTINCEGRRRFTFTPAFMGFSKSKFDVAVRLNHIPIKAETWAAVIKKIYIQSLRVRSSSVKELDTFYLFLIKSKTTWISQGKLYDSRNTTRWFWPTDFSSAVWWYAEIANCVHQLCCRHNPLQKVDVKQSKIWLTGYWNRLWPLITPASSLLPGQLVKRKPSQLKRLWDKVGCFNRN